MPWYISFSRLAICGAYSYMAYCQGNWIRDAEDAYLRSLTWKPVVATIYEHKIVFNKLGASHVWYRFVVDGTTYSGDQFRSGGIYKEEHVRNSHLLGVGTELVAYYNPANPEQSALKIANDRGVEVFVAVNIALCLAVAYRAVRCETVLPNLFYRFLNVNRRFAENTGLKTPNSSKPRPGMPRPAARPGKPRS